MLPNKLPEGWAPATIAELCRYNPKHDKKLPDDLSVSFVPMASVSDDFGEIVERVDRPLGDVRKGYTHFAEDDLLWAKITPCMQNGKSAIATDLTNGIGCGTTEFYVLRSKGAVVPEYLHRFMRQITYLQEAQRAMTGAVGQARVPKGFVLDTEIPLAPFTEQRRIVAKLDALEERRRAVKAKLDRLPDLLERYRQSVLAAAFRGDLTAGWRERHPDTEPADVLLERIRTERRLRWIEATAVKATERAEARAAKKGEMWDDETRAAQLAKERKKAGKKYEAPEPVDTTDLPDIPDGWSWASIEEMTDPGRPVCYGVVQPGKEVEGGIPLVRVCDLIDGLVEVEQLRTISERVDDQYSRSRVKAGDILVSLVGTIGRVALVDERVGEANIARALARLDVLGGLTEWVYHWLESPFMQNWLLRESREVARKTLNLGSLTQGFIPLPPQHEMEVALRQLTHLLRPIPSLIERVNEGLQRIDRLHQASLARAFRGELVPTEAELARREDREYEDAEALLTRVRAERDSRVSSKQKHTSSPKPAPSAGDGHDASPADLAVDADGQRRLNL